MRKTGIWECGRKLVKRIASSAPQVSRNPISEWTVTAILLLFGTTSLVQAFVIPSGSMENTLMTGDHVLVDKLVYAPAGPLSKHLLPCSDVKRGDIIVFRYPTDINQTFVKRAVGVPGDRIRIVNKRLMLNGSYLHEPYIINKTSYVDSYRDYFPGEPNTAPNETVRMMLEQHVMGGELIVPAGHYFALGDNRDVSSDSRYWGLVPRENIIGEPLIVYWSYDAPGEHLAQPGIGIDHLIDLAQNFFTKTRWDRTFKFIRGYPLQPVSP